MLDPSKRVDAGHHERAEIGAHQPAFLQLVYYDCNLFFQIEYHTGALLMNLEGNTQWFIRKGFQAKENRMVNTSSKARRSFITDPQGRKRSFLQIEEKLDSGRVSSSSTKPR
jgi:hypothetical protein